MAGTPLGSQPTGEPCCAPSLSSRLRGTTKPPCQEQARRRARSRAVRGALRAGDPAAPLGLPLPRRDSGWHGRGLAACGSFRLQPVPSLVFWVFFACFAWSSGWEEPLGSFPVSLPQRDDGNRCMARSSAGSQRGPGRDELGGAKEGNRHFTGAKRQASGNLCPKSAGGQA